LCFFNTSPSVNHVFLDDIRNQNVICCRFNIMNLQKQLIEYLSSVVRDYERAISEYRSRGYDLNHMDKELGFLDDGI
jgi:hypothetical protein